MNFDEKSFKKTLDEQLSFPALYMFKFIVPEGKEQEVTALFPKNEAEFKPSSKGKYISVTVKAMMESSEAIVNIYGRAKAIEGIIAL